MEITRSKLKLKLYGEDYEMSFPTISKWREYQNKITKGDVDEITAAIGFLCDLGLPKDVCEDVELEHLNQIISAFVQKKS